MNRIGETITAKNGQTMTIIAYRNNRDIDIQFSDKTVVLHKRYDHFLNGKIYNPNFGSAKSKISERIGLTKKMNNGLTAKIIEYKGNKNIKVEFENGVIKQGKWSEFENGTLTTMLYKNFIPTDKRVGITVKQNCGETATLIKYIDSNHVTVRFTDGTIRDSSWNNFYKCKCIDKNEKIKIGKQNNQKLIGTTYKNKLNLTYKIIEIKSTRDITIRFDIDGTIKKTTLSNIKYSDIQHPLFSSKIHINNITGIRSLITKTNTYYKCNCSNCNLISLMTPYDILSHQC